MNLPSIYIYIPQYYSKFNYYCFLKKEEKEKNNQNNIEKTLKVKNQKYPKFNYLTNLNEYKLFNLN